MPPPPARRVPVASRVAPPARRTAPPPAAVRPTQAPRSPAERATTPPDGYRHLLKESKAKGSYVVIKTTCGLAGPPRSPKWNGKRGEWEGIAVTGWASEVTCPDCMQHPGVSGPAV